MHRGRSSAEAEGKTDSVGVSAGRLVKADMLSVWKFSLDCFCLPSKI